MVVTRVFIVKIDFLSITLTDNLGIQLNLLKASLFKQDLISFGWRRIKDFLVSCLFVLWDYASMLLKLLQVWECLVETSDYFHK